MKRMVDAGMKPYDILKSGTYNVGLYLKGKDSFGTIEVGNRADLILLDANPRGHRQYRASVRGDGA
jgi:imidazolonepropionase-like amidohydrolase